MVYALKKYLYKFSLYLTLGVKMKVIVIIPAYNEELNICKVIREIKENVKNAEVLVINDGSKDKTFERAKESKADYIINNKQNIGLAQSFKRGLEEALKLGADIIVNTDADFQYNQKQIPNLIKPIVEGKADIVLTDRSILSLNHMPLNKKYGNLIATFVTKLVSGFNVRDAQSGFRAFSRDAALRLNVLSDYTYVQETIIQAVDKRLRILQMKCDFKKREHSKSRLIGNIFNYAKRAGLMIVRSYVIYKPLKALLITAMFPLTIGFLLGLRFLYYYSIGAGRHIQSLILAAILVIIAFQIIILAFIADTINANRKINEEVLYRIKKREFSNN